MSVKSGFLKVNPQVFSNIIEKNDITHNNVFKNLGEIGTALLKDLSTGEILKKDNRDEISKQTYENESIRVYGKNIMITEESRTLLYFLHKNMCDKMLLLLLVPSLISLLVGIYNTVYRGERYGYIEGLSILLAISIIVITSSLTEYTQELLFKSLETKKSDVLVKYIEDGIFKTKKASEVVVGDVLYIEPGDILPADALLVSNGNIFMDESMLTGESYSVEKTEKQPILFSSSCVLEGIGRCLVIGVGLNSTKGKLLHNMVRPKKETPLEKKSQQLAQQLTKKAIIISIMFFMLQLIKLYILGRPYEFTNIMNKAIEVIALAVMIIPEGLPMSTTMALSFGTKRMLQDNNLVRDISACEKMNNVRFLCTDKTGTLTHNKLKLNKTYVRRKTVINSLYVKNLFDVQGSINNDLIIKNIVFNSSAFKNQENIYIGSRLESALLSILEKTCIDILSMRKQTKVVKRQCFSSERKYMASIIEIRKNHDGVTDKFIEQLSKNKKYNDNHEEQQMHENMANHKEINNDNTPMFVVLLKGATEKITKHSKYEFVNDEKIEIDCGKIHKYLNKQEKLSQRTISMACALVPSPENKYLQIEMLDDLVFLGCFSFDDPLREGIEQKIGLIKNAGLNIVMLTGDGLDTARFIAEEVGILDGKSDVILGKKFRQMPEDELSDKIDDIRVVARATPLDKKRFIEVLQKKGEVVAVTGDGTNDGPALKLADVSFAMGLASTDVAKDASSIIILDGDFDSIIKSIAWGRCINDSIRKFLQLQLTVTICTVVLMVISSLFTLGDTTLFSPVQLLWINLYMDAFSAISLSSDRPTMAYLRRQPENPNNSLLTRDMKMFIFFSSTYILVVVSFFYFMNFASSFIFNVFFLLIMATQINARSLSSETDAFDNIMQNNYFIIVNTVVIVLQMLIMQKFNLIFHTEAQTVNEWLIAFGLAIFLLVYLNTIKYIKKCWIKKHIMQWNIHLNQHQRLNH